MSTFDQPLLSGASVRLEPLTEAHVSALSNAIQGIDRSTFDWAPVPSTGDGAEAMVADRLSLAASGSWIPYVQIRIGDGGLVGMTNFLNIERWNGPTTSPTSVEIGGTWLAPSAQRTPINTEAKLLLLTHAFEVWEVVRVQVKTDARNERSRSAILRLGATFEGVLRNYQPGQGDSGTGTPRDTAMYSIIKPEWPNVKQHLLRGLSPLVKD